MAEEQDQFNLLQELITKTEEVFEKYILSDSKDMVAILKKIPLFQ